MPKKQSSKSVASEVTTNTRIAVAVLALAAAGGLAFASVPLSKYGDKQFEQKQFPVAEEKKNLEKNLQAKCGVNDYSVKQRCANGYEKAVFSCFDGEEHTIGQNGVCVPAADLQEEAENICSKSCSPPPEVVAPIVCHDGDGGLNPVVESVVEVTQGDAHIGASPYFDTCFSDRTVTEYSCVGNTPSSTTVFCPNLGEDGRCVSGHCVIPAADSIIQVGAPRFRIPEVLELTAMDQERELGQFTLTAEGSPAAIDTLWFVNNVTTTFAQRHQPEFDIFPYVESVELKLNSNHYPGVLHEDGRISFPLNGAELPVDEAVTGSVFVQFGSNIETLADSGKEISLALYAIEARNALNDEPLPNEQVLVARSVHTIVVDPDLEDRRIDFAAYIQPSILRLHRSVPEEVNVGIRHNSEWTDSASMLLGENVLSDVTITATGPTDLWIGGFSLNVRGVCNGVNGSIWPLFRVDNGNHEGFPVPCMNRASVRVRDSLTQEDIPARILSFAGKLHVLFTEGPRSIHMSAESTRTFSVVATVEEMQAGDIIRMNLESVSQTARQSRIDDIVVAGGNLYYAGLIWSDFAPQHDNHVYQFGQGIYYSGQRILQSDN